MSVIEINRRKDVERLRRIALASQGLLQKQAFGRGRKAALRAIQHLGYVQIDTISVVERAHHHVFQSRVPGFDPAWTNRMLRERDIFEYWTHAAAFIPIEDFRFSLPYKHALKSGRIHWYRTRDKKLMGELLGRIKSDGPLRSRDLENNTGKKRAGWWDWKPAKKALEQLYMEGELMVSDREGFQKTYDLAERVLPSHINSTMPSMEEFAAHLLEQQLRCHGLVSLKGLTYLRRNNELRAAVKGLLEEGVSEKKLEVIKLDNGELFYMEAGGLEKKLPRTTSRVRILSPFDNSLIQRERLQAIFNFDYQLECYLPEKKRKYGYFSLPILYRDSFVGRMDCKAHRQSRLFEIKSLHLQDDSLDDGVLTDSLVEELGDFAGFQNCDSVKLGKVSPKNLANPLRARLKRLS